MDVRANRNLVAEALRSGKYKQGNGTLHNKTDDTYCCLGVACKVFMDNGGSLSVSVRDCGDNGVHGLFDGAKNFLPGVVQEWLGMNGAGAFEGYMTIGDTQVWSLVHANDGIGADFNTIATFFEMANFHPGTGYDI